MRDRAASGQQTAGAVPPPAPGPAQQDADAVARILRLAARMLDAPAALLAARDPEGNQVRVAYGFPPDDQSFLAQLVRHAADGNGALLSHDPDEAGAIRFRAGVPLRDPDGIAVGGIVVFDTRPRSEIGPDALGPLMDLATLAAGMISVRQRRLPGTDGGSWPEVWDELKALAVEATDYESAVRATTRALCQAAEGLVCTLHRLAADGVQLQMVAGFAAAAAGGAARIEAIRAAPLRIDDPLLGPAIGEGQARFVEDRGPADPARHPLFAGVTDGPLAFGAMPLVIGEEHCAILLARAAPGPGLPLVLREAAATLRPLLQMLRDEEQTLLHRRVVESSSEAVLITEAAADEARIVHVNPAFEALTGFTATELVGRTPRLLEGLDGAGQGGQAIRDAVRRRRPLRQTVRVHRKDGAPIWVDLHISPVTDAGGRCTHFVSMLRDVTREREATERLAESEAAFRSLFEQNPIPMWIYDPETLSFLSVNDAAVEDYGWSRDDFLRMTILDIRLPEDRAAGQDAALQPQSGRSVSGPWRHVTADGRHKLVQIISHMTEFGGRRAVLVAAWDVTARLRFEADLRLSRAALQRQTVELRRTQRLARLGTWNWQASGEGVTWSDEVHALFGTDPLGPPPTRDSMLALLHPEDRPVVEGALERIVVTGRPAAFEFRVNRPDGRTVHCRAEGHWEPGDEDGQGSVHGYVQDVTEQREAEAALRQADRLASLGQLTGGIAHDFNNLLTVASVSLEMAAEAAQAGRTSPDLIEAARAALDRGMKLTSQLLSYARRQPLRPKALDLGRLLPELLDLAQRTIGERYPIRLLAGTTEPVAADPSQLESALLNLLVNARDAMPDGGPITVETRLLAVDQGQAGLGGELAPGRYAAITVTDRGTGMPAEVQARIFEPFFTTKPAGRGTGLGLSMVLGFAKQSGGHVAVASEPGLGTTMKLFLPVVHGKVEQVADEMAPVAELPSGLDVLVVEDQPDVREAAVRLCREVGLEPVAVPDATDALKVLASGLRFDLLFTDVVLGGEIDGLELAEMAAQLQPGIAVVCTSGYTEQHLGRSGRLATGVELLTKPYDMRRFRAAAGRALQVAKAGEGAEDA
jgi:PAS domain S-box-containing protein